MKPSSKAYKKLEPLLHARAALTNPQVHFDLKDAPLELLIKELEDVGFKIEVITTMEEIRQENQTKGDEDNDSSRK